MTLDFRNNRLTIVFGKDKGPPKGALVRFRVCPAPGSEGFSRQRLKRFRKRSPMCPVARHVGVLRGAIVRPSP